MAISKDKVAHAAACYGAIVLPCMLALIYRPLMPFALALGIGLSAGAALGKEYGDYTHNGCWNWLDLLADFAGLVAGAACGVIF